MSSLTPEEKGILEGILKESKLTHNSVLYRYTAEKYLKEGNDTEVLISNQEPVEMVVDSYKDLGHVFIASDIGPGLSFLTEALQEYERKDRICVSVKIGDLLAQGGKIYKVTSLPAYITAFFVTLPSGEVKVKRM